MRSVIPMKSIRATSMLTTLLVLLATTASVAVIRGENFSQPKWWLFQNAHTYGYNLSTNYAGGAAGEMGGLLKRTSGVGSCYGDDVSGPFSLNDTMEMNWTSGYAANLYTDSSTDGYLEDDWLLGFFNRSTLAPWPPANYVGVYRDDTTIYCMVFSPAGYLSATVGTIPSGPTLSTIKFIYDPNSGSYGRLTAQLNSNPSVSLDLTQAIRNSGASFDTFGLAECSGAPGGADRSMNNVYVDNVSYSAAITLWGQVIQNNLVTQLTSLTSPTAGTYWFYNPRDGWVFFSGTSTADLTGGARIEVKLDGMDTLTVHQAGTPRTLEAMRWLTDGWYTLVITYTGTAQLQNYVAKAIPEITYSEWNDASPIYGTYDQAFLEKIGMLASINTIEEDGNNDYPVDSYCSTWQGQGKRWVTERAIGSYTTGAEYRDNWIYPFTPKPEAEGVMVDEFMQYTAVMNQAADLLLHDAGFAGKTFYPYCCSPSPDREDSPGLGVAFQQLVMDHNSHPAWERYLYEHATASEGSSFFDENVKNNLNSYWLPYLRGSARCMTLDLGNYMSAPPDFLNQAPGADLKVWMDNQYNKLANDPAYFGLYGVMEWTSGHADEEMIRWAAKLYRHYCIEGNTGSLASYYGFTYNPGHISNPDFDSGTTGWTTVGTVGIGTYSGYGSLEGRYPRTTQGDNFLVTTRRSEAPNTISQTITGLTQGKLYSVKLITGDYDNLLVGSSTPKTLAVAINLTNADLVTARCYQYVYHSNWCSPVGPFNNSTNPFWVNYHVKVFRATSTSSTLTISDWITPGRTDPSEVVGQRIALNFVEVQPYLEYTSLMWYDGFESGGFTGGGWTNSGCTVGSTYKYAGTYAAQFNSSDSLIKTYSTVGKTDINVQYARYTRTMEADDHFISEWSTNGTSWTTMENQTGNSAWTVKHYQLPTGADNQSGFRIRFRTSHNGSTDWAYLDEVTISGW